MQIPALKRFWWLAYGMVGLLLLSACAAASPQGQVAPTGTGEVLPTDNTAPTASAAPPEVTEPPPTEEPRAETEDEYNIVTLLPPDAIQSIDEPQFYDVIAAELEYEPAELVLGVELDGDARAYPIILLSRHEIVNDTVGGQPIAVTY